MRIENRIAPNVGHDRTVKDLSVDGGGGGDATGGAGRRVVPDVGFCSTLGHEPLTALKLTFSTPHTPPIARPYLTLHT